MPAKNAEKFILKTIESIRNQTFENWELIIVDDGSEDQTFPIIRTEALKDPRIIVRKNNSRGIISCLKLAFEVSQGAMITRMDADDLMPRSRLALMTSALRKDGSKKVVTGMVQYFGSSPISKGYINYENWLNEINRKSEQWKNIYRECVIASPNWLCLKQDLLRIRAFEKLQYPEDYDLVFKWYKYGFKIHTINNVTLHWREHPFRTSRVSSHYDQQSFFELKIKRFLELDYKKEAQLIVWGKGTKAKLASTILTQKKVGFEQMDLTNYERIQSYDHPQLLIAIFPTLKERRQIADYLLACDLHEGAHWWHL